VGLDPIDIGSSPKNLKFVFTTPWSESQEEQFFVCLKQLHKKDFNAIAEKVSGRSYEEVYHLLEVSKEISLG
jgi:hypothetical protein